jgi:hypothetical protein
MPSYRTALAVIGLDGLPVAWIPVPEMTFEDDRI